LREAVQIGMLRREPHLVPLRVESPHAPE
jgi:hypothetical protein